MEGQDLFFQGFIYLLAAVGSVPVAKRLGLGSVLGYLIAGVLIGPFVLGLLGDQGDVMHVAEFGVVMMLFLVGLELRPSLVWQLRGPILGMGRLQVALTALAVGALGWGLGVGWSVALAAGLILALSSTAIALQSLNERGLIKTAGGQSAFSVLLFQDIAVIPILALLPLLAMPDVLQTAAAAGHGAAGAHLGGWRQALLIAGVIVAIVLGGRYLARPAFRFVAQARLREVFIASALLLVVGVALAMQFVGLSPALGTFLAGVVLADNEYRHELEADIEPFKGLLLGLFFISVGASIDFALLWRFPLLVGALVLGLVALKFAGLFGIAVAFRLPVSDRWLFALSLAQGGEFAFVLLAFATQNAILPGETAALLVASVALSMVLAPLLLIVNERLVQPRFARLDAPREADAIDERETQVILAGFGRFGQIVGRLLLAQGVRVTVLDHDANQIENIRRFGFKVYYGDASRIDLLESAGGHQARLLVLAIDDREKTLEIAREARQHFPNLRVLARAGDLLNAYELLGLGVETVVRETFGSAIHMGVEALKGLGLRSYQALRAGQAFRAHDEGALRELAQLRHDQTVYMSRRVQMREELQRRLEADLQDFSGHVDSAWDAMPPSAG